LSSEEKFCCIEWENERVEGGSVGEKGVCGLRKKMKKKSFLRRQGNYL